MTRETEIALIGVVVGAIAVIVALDAVVSRYTRSLPWWKRFFWRRFL